MITCKEHIGKIIIFHCPICQNNGCELCMRKLIIQNLVTNINQEKYQLKLAKKEFQNVHSKYDSFEQHLTEVIKLLKGGELKNQGSDFGSMENDLKEYVDSLYDEFKAKENLIDYRLTSLTNLKKDLEMDDESSYRALYLKSRRYKAKSIMMKKFRDIGMKLKNIFKKEVIQNIIEKSVKQKKNVKEFENILTFHKNIIYCLNEKGKGFSGFDLNSYKPFIMLIKGGTNLPKHFSSIKPQNDEIIFICGGMHNNIEVKKTFVFEYVKFRLFPKAGMHYFKIWHSMISADKDTIYAIGGRNRQQFYLNVVEEYNFSTNKWNLKQKMNDCRAGAASCIFKLNGLGNRIFVYGGINLDGYIATIEYLVLASNDPWVKIKIEDNSQIDKIIPRIGSVLIQISDNQLLIAGGESKSFEFPCETYIFSVEEHKFIQSTTIKKKTSFMSFKPIIFKNRYYVMDTDLNIHIYNLSKNNWNLIYNTLWLPKNKSTKPSTFVIVEQNNKSPKNKKLKDLTCTNHPSRNIFINCPFSNYNSCNNEFCPQCLADEYYAELEKMIEWEEVPLTSILQKHSSIISFVQNYETHDFTCISKPSLFDLQISCREEKNYIFEVLKEKRNIQKIIKTKLIQFRKVESKICLHNNKFHLALKGLLRRKLQLEKCKVKAVEIKANSNYVQLFQLIQRYKPQFEMMRKLSSIASKIKADECITTYNFISTVLSKNCEIEIESFSERHKKNTKSLSPSKKRFVFVDFDQKFVYEFLHVKGKFIPLKRKMPISFEYFVQSSRSLLGNTLYICGGEHSPIHLRKLHQFEIDSFEVQKRKGMNIPKSLHFLLAVGGQKSILYSLGGKSNFDQYLNIVEQYNITQNRWYVVQPLNECKVNVSACLFNSNYIYTFGGIVQQDFLMIDQSSYNVSTIEKLDISNIFNEWIVLDLTYLDRHQLFSISNAASIQIAQSQIIIFGGMNQDSQFQNHSYIFDAKEQTVYKLENMTKSAIFSGIIPIRLKNKVCSVGFSKLSPNNQILIPSIHCFSLKAFEWTISESKDWYSSIESMELL